jgi:hypothetical protein
VGAPERAATCQVHDQRHRPGVPVAGRTNSLYHELKESHGTYEATHDWWRDRYKVAADDICVRPRVRDIGFHRLRTNVACLVEWLRICFCQGWLGNPRRNGRATKRGFQDRAERIKVRLANMLVRMGVAAPHGAKAACTNRSRPTSNPRQPPGDLALQRRRRSSSLFGN